VDEISSAFIVGEAAAGCGFSRYDLAIWFAVHGVFLRNKAKKQAVVSVEVSTGY
jgi:hypothetical protein